MTSRSRPGQGGSGDEDQRQASRVHPSAIPMEQVLNDYPELVSDAEWLADRWGCAPEIFPAPIAGHYIALCDVCGWLGDVRCTEAAADLDRRDHLIDANGVYRRLRELSTV
jgi:hypothetical protein